MATPFRLKRSAVSGKRPALADLQLGELALNTNNASLFAKRDTGGVGIGTTVTLLTPWVENFGGASIFYGNSVGIGTTDPTSTLTVIGTGASISQLFVTGVSTFVGVATFPNSNVFINNQLFVGGVQVNGGAVIGVDIETRHLKATGITTLGVTTASQLFVTGVSTFAGITTVTGDTLFSKQLNVTGVVTASGGIQGIGIQSGGINIATGILTALNFVGAGNSFSYDAGTKTIDINIGGGQWTYADTSNTTTSSIYRLNGNVGLGTTNPTSKLHVIGDARITGVLTVSNGIQGIGIQSSSTNITTGIITTLNFVGSAVSTITNTSGFVEINVKSGQFSKNTTSFTATAGQTTFSVTYTPNFIDVFVNGVRLTSSEFVATDASSVVLNEGATAGDIIDVVVFQNSGLFDSSKWTAADVNNPISGNIFKSIGNVGIGTTNPRFKLEVGAVGASGTSLHVNGDARITGILTIGTSSITLDGSSNQVNVGTGVTLHHTNGVQVGGNNVHSTGLLVNQINASGVVTATGGFNIGIQSGGAVITTGVVTAFNFVGLGNTFLYNTATKTVDISISGSALSISTSTTSVAQDLAFVGGSGTSVIGIATTTNRLVYIPSSGNLGIGTTNPVGSLQVGAGTSIVLVTSTGSVGIGTTNPFEKLDVLGILGIGGTTSSISTTTASTIDTLPVTTYRSARFQVQITQGTNYQSTDLMTIHDGTTSNLIEYGTISTGDYLASFSSTISGSNLLLRATMGSAGIATVKVARYGIKI